MSQEKAKASLSDRVREIILDAVVDKDQVNMVEVENAVTAIVDSISRLKEASARPPAAPGSEAALDALNAWFAARGHDVTGSTPDAWNITAFEEAFIFSAGQGRRSNTLYMVRGLSVLQLSSAFGISFKDAYEARGEWPVPGATPEESP